MGSIVCKQHWSSASAIASFKPTQFSLSHSASTLCKCTCAQAGM